MIFIYQININNNIKMNSFSNFKIIINDIYNIFMIFIYQIDINDYSFFNFKKG